MVLLRRRMWLLGRIILMKFLKRPLSVVLSVSVIFLFVMNFDNGDNGSFLDLHFEEIVYAAPDVLPKTEKYSEIEKAKKRLREAEASLKEREVALREKEKDLHEKESILAELLKTVKSKERALDDKNREIKQESETLQSVKKEINLKLAELEAVKAEILKGLEKKKAVHDANITKLAKVYESAVPEKAGPILSQIDVEIAAQILLKMNNMKAGKIWGFMDSKKAVKISKELAKYRSRSNGSSK